jgi:hypothetical protein
MWITAAPTTSPSAAHAIRQRLMNPPRAKAVLQITEVEQTARRPAFIYVREPADAHVEAWEHHIAENDPSLSVEGYIRLRCKVHKVEYLDMIGYSHKIEDVKPRHTIMMEVSNRFPGISRYQIGKAFGGRDSTTVFSALCKMGYVPQPKTVSPEMAEEMRRLYATGLQKKEIAKMMGVSGGTVTSHVDPEQAKRQHDRVREYRRRKAEAKKARAA